ncbi:MAG: periplasmic heavy metal sensor [Acidobacteria bacterium]|nr:periplasmic heavy metal sensor [Acidobacteriota bacterium]
MRKVLLAPVCALLLMGWAQAQEPAPPPAAARISEAAKKILDLSDQQVQQLLDLQKSTREKNQALMTQMRDLERQRRELLQSSNPDATKIGEIALQQRTLQEQLRTARQSFRESALAVLTTTQKEKVAQIQEALKLAPQAGPLAALGLLEGPGGPGGHGPGHGMMVRRFRGGPNFTVPVPPPGEPAP